MQLSPRPALAGQLRQLAPGLAHLGRRRRRPPAEAKGRQVAPLDPNLGRGMALHDRLDGRVGTGVHGRVDADHLQVADVGVRRRAAGDPVAQAPPAPETGQLARAPLDARVNRLLGDDAATANA